MEINPTIFLIDDDCDDQEIFSMAVNEAKESAKFVAADDGILALEKLRSDTSFIPDYIFIDINMPRMNGKECLAELKKIDRLRNVPVYMYSTSINPETAEESKSLGATDFIVKPSSLQALTDILRGILHKQLISVIMFAICCSIVPGKLLAQSDTTIHSKELKKLSVEELMNVEVTSVSKNPEKLSEVASSIQVIGNEEIKRSGTLRLPGALRLATNLQVSASGAHDSRISARGFNGYPISNSSLANKLLVLIDGRSVYTPLFGGVFWDVQNVLQEDIKQIEVISGPGGALWGANAVNGIVNIISKSAKETQGVYASGAAGTGINDFGAVRYGSHIDSMLYYRVYAQRFDFKSSSLQGGIDAKDAWYINQGGFRMDFLPAAKSRFILQGDLYDGKEDDTASTLVNGQNILGRWIYDYSGKSSLTVQSYYDRTYRNIQSTGFIDEINTFDIDIQHNSQLTKRNKLVVGAGYRLATDNINTVLNDFIPAQKNLHYFNIVFQDQHEIIPDLLDVTVGTKVLHNDYTGFELHPTIRFTWRPSDNHTIWSAISQAVRTPTRLEVDHPSPGLGSFGNFKSEKVIAYEAGYRVKPAAGISISIAVYYNHYRDLRSLDTNYTPPPYFYFGNNLEAQTCGAELSAKLILSSWWKLRGGYSWLNEKFTTTAASTLPQSSSLEAIDPANHFLIQSLMDVAKHFQVDATVRYVDVVPAAFTLPSVPSYITFDLRLAYNYKWLTLAAVGSNLAEKHHGSAGTIEISRSIYGRITVQF